MKRLTLFPLLLAACGPDKLKLATATFDTLPNGAVSVMSPGPTAWADTNGWKLVEVQELGTDEGDSVEFNQPGVTALDGEGRLYVTDEKPALIRVFDRQGRQVRTIGREGAGPGEFRVAFIAIHGSNLVVHDPQLSRTSVFDTSGTFLRSWASQCCWWTSIVVDRQGRAYIPGMSPQDSGPRYYRYPLDGSTVDTLQVWPGPQPKMWTFRTKNMGMATTVPFTPDQVVRVNPGGGFFVGMTNRYQIIESSTGRDTTRIFGRAWAAPPLSDHRRQAAVDSAIRSLGKMTGGADVKKTVNLGDLPTGAPAWTDIGVDGRGDRWVIVDPGEDSTHTWFDVFDSTGVYLGQVVGPPGLEGYRMSWSGDQLAAYLEDREGNPMIVRYEIRRGPGGS